MDELMKQALADSERIAAEMKITDIQDKIYDERRKHGRLLVEAAAKAGIYVEDPEAFISSCQWDDDCSIRNSLSAQITEAQRR